MLKQIKILFLGFVLMGFLVSGAQAKPAGGPDQLETLQPTYDGIPTFQLYHDFVVHATQLLEQWGLASFPAAGVGTFDIVLLTQSGVKNKNVAIGPGGQKKNFEEPVQTPAGSGPGKTLVSEFSDTWGDNDPVYVTDILQYLHYNFGRNKNGDYICDK